MQLGTCHRCHHVVWVVSGMFLCAPVAWAGGVGVGTIFDYTLSDVPDFDQQFMTTTIVLSSVSSLTFTYDYIEKKSSNPKAGYVFDWVFQTLFGNKICPSKRYFQQREVYDYESVDGYPKPVLSTIAMTGTPDFLTTGYTVMDNDTGLNIEAVNGWYRIPAGHSITVRKRVTTPDITLYNDDISDVSGFSSYTPNLYDKSISWFVDRNLNMSLVHDAGEGNISSMPMRSLTVGEGTKTYLISR